MYSIKELQQRLPQIGKVDWIGVRPKSREEVKAISTVEVKALGLDGDHYSGKPGSKRQVTLIQSEHLDAVARIMGRGQIDPADVRRNLVVSGINLLALKDRRFQVGEVILEGTGNCSPCSRMEQNLGEGGWNSMRGHGGITARIIQGGDHQRWGIRWNC